MPKRVPEKKIVNVAIAKLKSHPLQEQLYQPRANWQIADLAKNIETNGLEAPIEITPDFIIISGYGRVAAVKTLAWKTIPAWIRYDLAEAGPDAIELRLVQANTDRRNLGMLDLARSYRHILQIERGRRGRRATTGQVKGDLRDIAAKKLGFKSGRTLDRWNAVLDLPMPIQQAVQDGRLQMTVAVKIPGLDAKVQRLIADEIASGNSPKEVIAKFMVKKPSPKTALKDSLVRLLSALERAQTELEDHVPEVHFSADATLKTLRGSRDLLTALIGQVGKNAKRRKANEKKLPHIADQAAQMGRRRSRTARR